jgi:hypothetical protein
MTQHVADPLSGIKPSDQEIGILIDPDRAVSSIAGTGKLEAVRRGIAEGLLCVVWLDTFARRICRK